MSQLLKQISEIIIETLVLTPILCVAIFLFSIALIVYPLKNIRMWLALQGIRIVEIWAYYIENRDAYFRRD